MKQMRMVHREDQGRKKEKEKTWTPMTQDQIHYKQTTLRKKMLSGQ